MTALAAVGVSVRLGGATVLHEVTLALQPGEVTALVGPNGAGKSTLLGVLAGLRRPDAGEVRLGASPLLTLTPRDRARRIGVLPQTPEIAWPLDVRALVGLGRIPHAGARGLAPADAAAIDRALAACGLEALAARAVDTLSGGQRARVLIARALAGEPQWLLADEPLAGLDPGHVLDVGDLLRRLAGEGRGVLLTLHDLSAAVRFADRVVLLSQGRVLADGPPRDALTSQTLAQAYGVTARITDSGSVEVEGRSPPSLANPPRGSGDDWKIRGQPSASA